MKILLISPHLVASDRYGKALGKVGTISEPLSLAYLAAAIKEKRNDEVTILDACALNYNSQDLEEYLKKDKWDIIGLTILTPMYQKALEAIEIIKKIDQKVKIIVGGPHPTIFPEETLKHNPNIDFAIYGEGEITIVELLDALEKNTPFNEIKGLVYRKGKEIIKNSQRPFIKDLDEVPLPARELLNMNLYKPAPTYYNKLPSFLILTSRGCPYRCVYCSKVSGNLYRHHSINRIIKEIEVLIKDYNAKEIIFRDDTFTINKKHVEDLCQEIIKRGLNKKIKWTCMTRVPLVTEDLLKLMRKAGCWSIHYGVESGSQRLLDLIQKDITIQQVKDAFNWTRKAGIEIKAFFMLGLPTETKEESLQTIKFTKDSKPDWIQVTITVPYPGTKLYELAQKDGTLKSLKWENYQTWAGWSDKELVYTPKDRDAEELKELQRRAMREFYLSPRFIIKQFKNLRSWNNIKTYSQGAYALIKSKFNKR